MPEDGLQMRPFVQVACICQTPIQEVNGYMTVVRIMDRIAIPGFTPTMPPTPLQNLCLLLILKAGLLRETHSIRVVPVTPSGKSLPAIVETNALFEGDERGTITAVPVPLVVNEEGLYWFDVFVEEDLLTRIPLRLIYQRLPMPIQPPPTN